MRALFAPSSIVVVGGSNDVAKPGGRVVLNLKQHGRATIWAVNPKGEAVQGLPTFATIPELPAAADLAIVSIPAPQVLAATSQLLALGTRAFIVLSAGFAEVDARGRAIEQELVALVRGSGALLVGPNSLGIITPDYFGVFGGPAFDPVPGTIDLISASGSTAAFIIEAGLERGLQFTSMVSVGNAAGVGVDDFLAWQDEHHEATGTRTTLLYLESIPAPQRLLAHARSLHRKGCRIVALKAGTTEVGARAASSHTGAMASPDAAVTALCDKAGVVRVASRTEMVDVAGLLTSARPPLSDDIVIVTHAGGPGILLADELSRQGFRVPELPPTVQAELLAGLAPGSSARNPIDFLASGTAQHLQHIFRVLAGQPVGAAAVVFGSPGLCDVWPAFQELLAATRALPFPVYPVLPSVRTAAAEAARFRSAGGFHFTDEVALARALGAIRRTPAPAPDTVSPVALDDLAIERALHEAAVQGNEHLAPAQVAKILSAAGFRLPLQAVVTNAAEAGRAAAATGFPVVLKVVGPVHKSDVHGVLVGLRDEPELTAGFARLMQIPGAEGALVQQQVAGVELILGASREDRFGHLVLFGVGGILTEIWRDVTMGLAPLSLEESSRMVAGLRGAALLDGARGRAGVDRTALAEALVRLAALVHRFPAIAELDINPLMGVGSDLYAVDARIRVG